MRRRLALVLLAVLATAPAARAGGDWHPLVAAAGRVWVGNGDGVIEFAASDGRILHVAGTRYPFTTDLALTGRVVWAASVTDGYTAGAVTRVPFDASHGANALVLPGRPLYELASDGHAVWALTGPHAHQRLARIDAAGRRVRFTAAPSTVGFLAADPTGEVAGLFALTSRDVLLRYDAAGRPTRLARLPGEGDAAPAVGLGSVWLVGRASLVRVDARTGRVEGRLRLPGASALEVTVREGAVWLRELRGNRLSLLHVDPTRMRVTARTPLRGIAGERLAVGDGSLWLSDSSHRVWRIDPVTLRRTLFATLP